MYFSNLQGTLLVSVHLLKGLFIYLVRFTLPFSKRVTVIPPIYVAFPPFIFLWASASLQIFLFSASPTPSSELHLIQLIHFNYFIQFHSSRRFPSVSYQILSLDLSYHQKLFRKLSLFLYSKI